MSGYIGVSSTTGPGIGKRSGTLIGYFGNPQVDPSTTGASRYTFTVPSDPTTVVQLTRTTDNNNHCAVSPYYSNPTLGPQNTVYLRLENTRSTTAAGATSKYVYDTNAIGYAETTIFTVDPDTGDIGIDWFNPDYTALLYIVLYQSYLYVTGDVSAFEGQIGSTNVQVVDLVFMTAT
ncbi:hypothetical protein JAAARDRAFT_191135 [Jaapia argillacea MUCL 33604]|uniref:Uncharacterized protein n=1 Tax=Jaapia argillacea MUCL 33604 TaxID=933084 RepID=A0A067Q236_9AGAM|nr:hypothetical protein JAAARDRAFT_191135 [Jaapia argillacea MUCL 33604]